MLQYHQFSTLALAVVPVKLCIYVHGDIRQQGVLYSQSRCLDHYPWIVLDWCRTEEICQDFRQVRQKNGNLFFQHPNNYLHFDDSRPDHLLYYARFRWQTCPTLSHPSLLYFFNYNSYSSSFRYCPAPHILLPSLSIHRHTGLLSLLRCGSLWICSYRQPFSNIWLGLSWS